MSLSCKIMSSRFKNITLCFVILTLCFFSITFLTGSIFGISLSSNSSNVSALTYSTEEDISFTFAPSLSITLSDTDLVIDTLAPGNTAESNIITVSVASNTPYGYALYADVGSNDTSSQYYNTSSLIRSDNINATFTSIATNASLATLATDNTWGYSTSKDNGTTWSAFSGLPTATSTSGSTSTDNPAVLIDTKLPADNQSIALKVAARSSTTQASGTYSNIINFYVVGKPKPIAIGDIEYLQDFTLDPESIKSSMDEHATYTKKDKRDGREYTIAKLKDGKIWMTQNLDLAIGTELYSETSNVPSGYPESSGVPYFTISYLDPSVHNVSYSSVNRTICAHLHPCYSYYSWTTATAGGNDAQGNSVHSSNIDAVYSICPKGWKLPSARTNSVDDWQLDSDFYQLAVAYGMSEDYTFQSSPIFYNQAGQNTIPNFLLTGYIYSYPTLGNGGYSGYYWSSTSYNESSALDLFFDSAGVYPDNFFPRRYGNAVRCIAE